MEISDELVEHSTSFADERGVADRVRFVQGFGEELPLGDSEFDLVTMYDVMEHVVDPRRVIEEAYRVLRPGGLFAVVFPPYYDITAGSHLHGYATRAPGLNLLFSTRQLKSAAMKLFEEQGVDWRRYMREVPSDKLWNQNGLTAAGFRRLVEESRFTPVEVRYLGHRDPRTGNNNPGVDGPVQEIAVRVNRAVAQVPVVQEAVCSRVAALLRK
jgi:SAM-dependent methyltransferase